MTMILTVIVRAADLGEENPPVVATHDPAQGVGPDAYAALGPCRALALPASSLLPGDEDEPGTRLAAGWRDHLAAAVKMEARRRILAVYPEWRQANLTARGVELVGAGEADWTQEEAAEAAEIAAAWAWIRAVRAASDELEAAPGDDPFDDARWPAPPEG